MAEYVVRADTSPRADLSGTAFAHLDVRWLVNEERNGAQLTGVGQTVYPSGGVTHETHYHPNAEETVIVQSGSGRHRIGDEWYDIAAGDVVFIPKGAVHTAVSGTDGDLVIYWVLGGAATLEDAGYVPVEDEG